MQARELREMFDYLIDTRARVLDHGRALGWEEFSRDRGASWGSMLGIFLHLLDDEEGWLQIATQGGSVVDTPDRKPSAYVSLDQVAEDNARVGALTHARLAPLSDADLERTVEFWWPEETVHRSFEKIALHAFVDELAHVGELICLSWQLDVKPPYLDWIDYRG